MQFNSFVFVLLFMPIVVIVYFFLNKFSSMLGKIVIIAASLFFYFYAGYSTFIVLSISLIINFLFARVVSKVEKWHTLFVIIPILINVGLLLYFKYLNFVIANINFIFAKEIMMKELVLPLGISFFTFQQIAYMVAVYRKEIENINILDYLSYILFFPKLLMGPLVDPVEFIAQLNDESKRSIDWNNIAYGIKIFCFGLFKKVMIADVFANAVSWGYANIEAATSMDWILIMLFYTFEIYFDFSGYSDMATGVSLMFNIMLPMNFDSPYKALSIRDFWKRWHISLTKFFTKYIYIPLGGSRKGKWCTCINTMIVFLVSGVWHGANWTYILWGGCHGVLVIMDRFLEKVEKKIFEPVRWGIAFGTINILWLLFRSESISQWKEILSTIFSFSSSNVSEGLLESFLLPEAAFLQNTLHLEFFTDNIRGFWMILYILGAYGICLVCENNYRNVKKNTISSMILAALTFVWGLLCLSQESVFVYSNY